MYFTLLPILVELSSEKHEPQNDYMIYLFCNPKSGGNKGAVLTNLKVFHYQKIS
jgi:hypothetical protein